MIGRSKDKASVNPNNFQIDGYFKSDSEIFDKLLQKINLINNKDKVEIESKKKIMSAIRYYRTGSESPEFKTKFLNYWIGLEFIYTSFDAENKTIERIRTYLPTCHSLIYVKRNLYDFHKTLERLGVSSYINGYNSNLLYLSAHETYNTIINNTDSELLKFRAKFYQKWREYPGKITDVLKKHNSNLTR